MKYHLFDKISRLNHFTIFKFKFIFFFKKIQNQKKINNNNNIDFRRYKCNRIKIIRRFRHISKNTIR